MRGTFGNWLGAVIVLSPAVRIELYSRRLDFYSASPAFFLLHRECFMWPWSSRGGAGVCMPFRGQYLWLRVRVSRSILSQQPCLSTALSTRGRGKGATPGRGTAPEWLSYRSIRIYFLPREPRCSRRRAMRGTGATADHKTRTTRAKLLGASIYIPHPPPSTLTSLLVSSVPSRSRNPTFEHATSVTSDEDELPRCSIKRLFRPR